MNWIYFNNDFIPSERGLIHFRDLTLQRGYGVFDFFRLSGNTPLYLDDHLNRFYFSIDQLRLPVVVANEDIKAIITDLIRKNDTPDTGVRIALTGGYSEDSISIGQPVLVISQHTFLPPTAEQKENGIRLMLFPHQRQLPQVKSIDYMMAIWLQPLLKQSNGDDILYHNEGIISECPRSNVFIVTQDDKLVTPAINMLKGITRMKVLQKANQYFEVEERNISIEELKSAKEVFITSTTKQILPVSQVDEQVYTERGVTRKLQELLITNY